MRASNLIEKFLSLPAFTFHHQLLCSRIVPDTCLWLAAFLQRKLGSSICAVSLGLAVSLAVYACRIKGGKEGKQIGTQLLFRHRKKEVANMPAPASARASQSMRRPSATPARGGSVHGVGDEGGDCRRAVAVLAAILALVVIAIALVVIIKRDAGVAVLDKACIYMGPGYHPKADAPEALAMDMGHIKETQIGANWLPVRLALNATPSKFDDYVGRLQGVLCSGVAPRFDVDEEALQSTFTLLTFLRNAATALEASPVRTGLLVFRHIDRAPHDVREALKGLFDSGRLHGQTPVPNLKRSWLRFIVALRVPPEVDESTLYNARVGYMMRRIAL
jgi:hypothetical protein